LKTRSNHLFGHSSFTSAEIRTASFHHPLYHAPLVGSGQIAAPLDHLCRNPYGGDVIGDISDDGCPGTDNATLTDLNTLDNANADPDMRKFPLL